MAGFLAVELIAVEQITADIAGRDAEMPGGRDEDVGEVLADAVAERKGLDGAGAGIGQVDLEPHAFADALHDRVEDLQRVGTALRLGLLGEDADRGIGFW